MPWHLCRGWKITVGTSSLLQCPRSPRYRSWVALNKLKLGTQQVTCSELWLSVTVTSASVQRPPPVLSLSACRSGCSSWLLLQHCVCYHAPYHDENGLHLGNRKRPLNEMLSLTRVSLFMESLHRNRTITFIFKLLSTRHTSTRQLIQLTNTF